MVPVEIKLNAVRAIERLENAIRGGADFTRACDRFGFWMIADARRRIASRPRSGGGGLIPKRFRTGRLQNSLRHDPDPTGVTVKSNLVYANVQQYGADIYPKKKFLAIPMTERLARSGTWPSRHPDQEHFRFVPTSGRIAFLKNKLSGETLYFLHPGPVKVRPPPYLVFDARARTEFTALLSKHLDMD